MRALKQAVEDRLRSDDCFGDSGELHGRWIRRSSLGQPHPDSGRRFIGIDGDGFQNSDTSPQGLDERYGILVVVTFRMDYSPIDRKGAQATLDDHIDETVDRVRSYLHGDYTTLASANAAIGATHNGFVEPLTFRGASALIEKGPAWFHAEEAANPPAGLAVELRFGGARRLQLLGSVS